MPPFLPSVRFHFLPSFRPHYLLRGKNIHKSVGEGVNYVINDNVKVKFRKNNLERKQLRTSHHILNEEELWMIRYKSIIKSRRKCGWLFKKPWVGNDFPCIKAKKETKMGYTNRFIDQHGSIIYIYMQSIIHL